MKCQNCGFELQEQDRFCKKCGSKVERPAAPAQVKLDGDYLPSIWPDWKMEKKAIGQGTYGTVYKAVRNDHNVQSTAAIKVITIPSNPSEIESLRSEGMDYNGTRTYFEDIVNDFVKEIQLMESLKGMQNIVSVEDYKVVEKTGEIGWTIYIRMELLTPFNAYICDKKLTEEEVINLGIDICTALEVCAQRNIIHRDIKPENIFINNFGCYKLGDFGIARKLENVTGGLSQKGSPNFMAPEVASGKNYDNRVDIYSLGIVLYRLLNNNLLPLLDRNKQIHSLNDRKDALERRLHGEALPAPSEASEAMADLILRACAFDPAIRFASAKEMKQALQSVSNGTYQPAATVLDQTTAVHKAPDELDQTKSVRKVPGTPAKKNEQSVDTFDHKPKKKSKLPVVIAIILAVAILIGAGVFVISKLSSGEDEPEDASGNETVNEDDNSGKDADQIAAIISEAEGLAAKGDYQGALEKVKAGLVSYPDSKALQNKVDEYTNAINNQAKEKVLADAKAFADSGDYISAIALIQEAQKTNGDDTDYQTALKTYCDAYKAEVISSADALAAAGDHVGAITMINEAKAVLGEDPELSQKTQSYEDEYVNGVVAQVDSLIAAKDFEAAYGIVNEALTAFPDNAKLQQALASIEEAQKQSGSAAALNPNQNPVMPKKSEEHNISGGTNKTSAVEVVKEDLYHSSFTTEGQVEWFKFTTSVNYSAYSIEMLNNSIDCRVYMTIYDSYDNEIKQIYVDKGKKGYLDISLNSETEYWIKVSRYYDEKMGNYQFSIKEKICDAGMKQAEAFYVDLGVQNTKSFDVHGVNDWYRFTTTNHYATYQFLFTNNSVDSKLYLTVYDEYNTEMGSVSASKGETKLLDLALTANREYTVKLSRYYDDRNGYYQMSVVEKICDAGLRQSEAVPLEINTTFYGTADTSFAEWYVYKFTETDTFTLKLTNNNIDSNLYATVYDPLGTELGSIRASKNSSVEHSLEIAAGTILYVKISRYYPDQFGNYALLVY